MAHLDVSVEHADSVKEHKRRVNDMTEGFLSRMDPLWLSAAEDRTDHPL